MHKHITPYFYFTLLSIAVIFITMVLVFSFKSLLNNAYAESPFFSPQEMRDPYNDWKVRLPGNKWIPAPDGNNNVDLLAINYFSEGQFLNSTLWLNSPNRKPS